MKKNIFSLTFMAIAAVLMAMSFSACCTSDNAAVPVTGVIFDQTSVPTVLSPGKTATIKVTVTPDNASKATLLWTSSNENVATVAQDGTVTAVAVGTVTITATATDGSGVKAECTITVEPEYVVIGGLKWATMNLGATTVAGSPETSYGDYYAWGEVATYYTKKSYTAYNAGTIDTWNTEADNKPTHVTGPKTKYDWTNYYGSNTSPSSEPWDPAPYDATTKNLTSDYDVANKTLGGSWRMPKGAEFNTLLTTCGGSVNVWTATIDNTTAVEKGKGVYFLSVAGCTVNSVTYNVPGALFIASDTDKSQCVFFPAAGVIDSSLSTVGTSGSYWSSSNCSTKYAYRLYFGRGYVRPQDDNSRCFGYPVRPVCPVSE